MRMQFLWISDFLCVVSDSTPHPILFTCNHPPSRCTYQISREYRYDGSNYVHTVPVSFLLLLLRLPLLCLLSLLSHSLACLILSPVFIEKRKLRLGRHGLRKNGNDWISRTKDSKENQIFMENESMLHPIAFPFLPFLFTFTSPSSSLSPFISSSRLL